MPLDVARAAVASCSRAPSARLRASVQSRRSPHRDGSGVDVLAHAPDTVAGVDDALIGRVGGASHVDDSDAEALLRRIQPSRAFAKSCSSFTNSADRSFSERTLDFVTDYDLTEEYRQLALAGLSFERSAGDVNHGARETFWTKGRRPHRAGPARRSDDSCPRTHRRKT